MKQTIIAGLDIGNGYVKGKVQCASGAIRNIDMPSAVTYTVGTNIPKNADAEYMKDLINELDVTMVSNGIKSRDDGRVLFGTRGIRSGESQTEFNIDNHTPKCQDSLSTMLILGTLAGTAVQDYFEVNKALPTDTLEVNAIIGMALPIEDYMDYKDVYANTLKSGKHTVHIHNFGRIIAVDIHFVDVAALAEGAAGQYAISSLGAPFLQGAVDIARAQGAQIDPAYTGEVLVQAVNTIGIDIGEGTVNFPVFTDGNIKIESSKSINKGYGSILSAVVSELRNTHYAFESRKALADFMLQDHVMPTQKRVAENVQRSIDKHARVFVRDVITEYANIFRKLGVRTDVVYIYGGGANPVYKFLYPALIEASTLEEGSCLPIIYLDSSYSRDLNRNGLFQAAQLLAGMHRAKAGETAQ